MLVLSRKIDESIMIGSNVKITILGIEDDRIRIGIDAPKDVRIFRNELIEQTGDTNVQAAHVGTVKLPWADKKHSSKEQ